MSRMKNREMDFNWMHVGAVVMDFWIYIYAVILKLYWAMYLAYVTWISFTYNNTNTLLN